MLRIDDDAVFVIDWAPVPRLRRTKHKLPHCFHEFATVARIPDRGAHLNPCHTPVRPNPEPDLVPPFISGRRPRGDIWYQARRGPENITRAATRARTGIGAGPGPAARPCPPGRPRSLSRPTRRSIARPHNRNGLGRGGHDERWDGHVDLHRLRDWGNRRNRDGGRGWDVFRARGGRCWEREGEPADRGTAATTTPASWARASTASPLEQRGAAPQHQNGDGHVRQELEGSRRPFAPLGER